MFRREGDYWTVEHAGASFRLRHCKGLDHLARLLALAKHLRASVRTGTCCCYARLPDAGASWLTD